MPKGFRKPSKAHKPAGTVYANETDVTINDVANAAARVTPRRLKKSTANGFCSQVKDMCNNSRANVEELSWEDKDLTDFNLLIKDKSGTSDAEEDLDETLAYPCGIYAGRRSKCKKSNECGIDYPIDVYFLIGSYIDPEDIGRFAGICRATNTVIHSAQFWISLFKRYYKEDSQSIDCVDPERVLKLHGLRGRVSRALFHIYPPFKERCCTRAAFRDNLATLEGALCVGMWYTRPQTHWHFCFKLKLPGKHCYHCRLRQDDQDNLLSDPDVNINGEDRCCVLEVLSHTFIPVPVVLGQVLRRSTITVGHGMHCHRLKMFFCEQVNHRPIVGDATGTNVVVDPVHNVYTIHWWDPRYPFPL